ncbi:hypothetical protein OPV22_004104 [Ensete ventricosum]|uniref:Uncharacterized protein n=1 Tax=Ensete ventricosum TaxID=4639 RepID=A0AAV8S2T1_ENSVE|nr:hypothetical protein OPV22_004104 [Ensete ventricosum]
MQEIETAALVSRRVPSMVQASNPAPPCHEPRRRGHAHCHRDEAQPYDVSAALLAFAVLRSWTKLLHMIRILSTPFTRQDATTSPSEVDLDPILLGLNKKTYEQARVDTEGNVPGRYKDPGMALGPGSSQEGNSSYFLLFLIYSYGTATAILINGFHTPHGDNIAKKQVHGFAKYFAVSFLWSTFQWFNSGGDGCGFSRFPVFGLKAWKQRFFFDFSLTMSGLQGYKVFLPTALIVGDGLYNFLKVLAFTARDMHARATPKMIKSEADQDNPILDDLRRNNVYIEESIPVWLA